MTCDNEDAVPGVAPGSRGHVEAMFAAVYGELVPHPWADPDSAQDEYFLFYDRSLAMGWLSDVDATIRRTPHGIEQSEVGTPRLWGMNDAGREHPFADSRTPLVAWFQAGIEQVARNRPLPVQPFLQCASDATTRRGTLRLQAAQILLPVQCLDTSFYPEFAQMPSLLTMGWFGDCDPRSRTAVRVTLDSGQSTSIPSSAPQMQDLIRSIDQEVFVCQAHSLTEHDPLAMHAPFDDSFWNGPAFHRATLRGTLAEWSLDAIGWMGSFLADLCARQGVTTPLLLTATRS